ncbi:stationary phase survival protein SurE [Escherichia coli]|nr:multifunctional surE domain protein [Shigella sonnei 53G]VEA50496.1 stationary phase survival protein SurE [Escherichia coli]
MRILLSNDDGVHAPGIQTLAKALREFADVQVVAPIVTAAALQIL